jgi:haloalkane dehalogenase
MRRLGRASREMGSPDAPVALFLHGNPTSSYIWRNVVPHVDSVARFITPDLIGFGQSGKPDIQYRFEDHVRYLDAFIDESGLTSAYVIAQDWGTAVSCMSVPAPTTCRRINRRRLAVRLPS